jgi:hypoxanthine-guanine phosphoribosyltransferase
MTGGIVFCGQLLTRLDFPLDFDYLHATRYGPETQGGKISWRRRRGHRSRAARCWSSMTFSMKV